MVVADSVSVFAEGTFEEQVQELVEYIARTKPESERAAFKTPFADAFKISEGQEPVENDEERKRKVISQVVNALDDLGEGSDKETEGFFNLLFSHMIGIYEPDSAELSKGISKVLDTVSHKDVTEHASVKYRVLSNLFNALPRTSPARLLVCKTLLKLAAENDELDNLHLTPTDVDRWLTEWDASPEEKTDFLRSVVDAFTSAGEQEVGFAFLVSHVRSLTPPAAEKASIELMATALRIPTFFDFDSVLRLESVQAQSSNELHGLLVILNKQGLEEFRTWREKNQSILDEYDLDAAQLERKMRLLILSEMGFSKIGQNLTYTEIASALQIEVQEVEKWAIDVVRAGLLSGKLSQTTQTVHVIRAVPRGFAKEQWNVLEQRLLAWKEGLVGIQSVLSATRQSIGTAVVSEQAA